jgi:peptidoglycan-associated lipoprotein
MAKLTFQGDLGLGESIMVTDVRRAAPWGGLSFAIFLAACSTPDTNTGQTTGVAVATPAPQVSTQPQRPVEINPFATAGGDRILFALDRHDLSEEARGVVTKWGEYLRTRPSQRFTIEGHADERGTREYNLALADRRAMSVRDHLISQGVRPGQLRTVSYGKERPAVTGSSEQAWSQNRRAVAQQEQ